MLDKANIIKLFYPVIFASLLSCNQAEISQNITLTVDFVLDENSLEFSSMIPINAFDESQVLRDYGNKITGIEIQGIVYYVAYFTGPGGQQIISANLEVAGPDGTEAALIASLSGENLQSLLYEQKEMVLQEEGVKRLAELIKNAPHEFRLLLSGISNLSPNDYTLTLQIGIKMSAYPL